MLRRCAMIAALPFVAASADAQTLRGRAVQPPDGGGIPGVLVLLIDPAGAVIARALTNEQGEYRVTAPRAGVYRLRTLRIGYQPASFGDIDVAADATIERQLALTSLPLSLDTVRVQGRTRCAAYDGASSVALAWEQTRTALTAADLTQRNHALHATVMQIRRQLDGTTRRPKQESSTESSDFVIKPFGTVSTDSLHNLGYVYRGADSTMHWLGPDVEALLSDNFVQDHCFKLATGKDPTLLGVAFEPPGDRKQIPDIAGTVWLDRKSAELRSMEYRYVNLAPLLEREAADVARNSKAGGELDFVRMGNGGWAISRWEIHVPVLAKRFRPGTGIPGDESRFETYVHEQRVEAGLLKLVLVGQDTLWRARP
jgi:hypothetical protein